MGDTVLKNISNLLTGQRDKILTDSFSDNKKVYLLISKLRPFLSLIISQKISTSCSNEWITIIQKG
jgi:hypothetical protein